MITNPLVLLIFLICLASVASLLLIILLRRIQRSGLQVRWSLWMELAIIGLWTMWVGRDYLNFSPTILPNGREFGMAIQSHFVWQLVPTCGPCVMWNGLTNGGAPAFVDLYGAVLHPIVIAATLLFGAIDGVKIILLAALFTAGIAQWALAKVMHLGRVPGLWAAAMAVAGGHLAGKMEHGLVALVLSIAAVSLVIAPGLKLALTRKRRATVLFAITLALALLAGQGYLQIGLLVSILPAFLVFFIGHVSSRRTLVKEFVLAALLTLLLTAVLWVPVWHAWPNLSKPIDPALGTVQSIDKMLLDLVTSDISTYFNGLLQTTDPLYLYLNYIGWIPIGLALLAIPLALRTSRRRVLYFMLSALILVFLAASGLTFKLIASLSSTLAYSVRFPSLIAGLAVPLILGLAAWGLDLIIKLPWPRLIIPSLRRAISIQWLVLSIPLLLALSSVEETNHTWLTATPTPQLVFDIIQRLVPETQQAEWITITSGEQFWIPAALNANLKLAYAARPWKWGTAQSPPSYRMATTQAVDEQSPNYLGKFGVWSLMTLPENEYAVVEGNGQRIPCEAQAHGGDIDVKCDTLIDGVLRVYENSAADWYAKRDNATVTLETSPWLTVVAPKGQHHYEFRYRPWDVWVGLSLTLIGIALCVRWWLRSPAARPTATAEVEP